MLLKYSYSFSLNADRAPQLKAGVIPPIESMPFFSVGYPDKERVEVTLLGSPSDPKSEGYDWVKAFSAEVGAFKGELEIYLGVSDMIRFKEQLREPV